MICLAASGPLLASWQPRFLAVGSTESTPLANGAVRPEFTSVWLGQPSWTMTMGLSGLAAFHCLAIWAPISNETLASSLRAVGIPVSAMGLKNAVMTTFFFSAASTPGLAASASQMCSVAAFMPWATIWSMLAVMVALADLPSNANTSAPYFSLAYFLASAYCAWWKTLPRSDTKKAIFVGLSLANAWGTSSETASSPSSSFFIFLSSSSSR